ncbi:MAG: hypothetical protein DRP15_01785 [Candidatus Aenigmatarchaeota archaeon]|nr:MAG: hypothetical protein DRP15_01785 [Candidatus Aenigmarchaeota archaeon]
MGLTERFRSFGSIAKEKLKLSAELAKQIKEERKAIKKLPEAIEKAVEKGVEKAERKEKERFEGETAIYIGACFAMIASVLALYTFVIYFDTISKTFILLTTLLFSPFSQELLVKATMFVFSVFSFLSSNLLITLLLFLGVFYFLLLLGVYQKGMGGLGTCIVFLIIFSILLLFHPLIKNVINNFLDNQLSNYIEKFKNSEFGETFEVILNPQEAINKWRLGNV